MDPIVAGQTATFLQSSGPWGAIALLICVVVYLYKRTVTLQEQLGELHEKRVTEVAVLAANTATGLTTSSSAISASTLAANSSNGLLQQVLDVVRPLAPAIEANTRQLEVNAQKMDRIQETVLRGDRS